MRSITTLGYALLGLIRDEPRSGYALRKVFELTPLGNYSSSPGSIYPALKALEKAGYIAGRPVARGSVFHLTRAGTDEFLAWLGEPVDVEMVAKQMSGIMLRFAFLTGHADRSLTFNLLTSLEAAAREHASNLATWLDSEVGQSMPLQARLAVMQGQRSITSVADWAADAFHQLQHAGEAQP